MYRRAASQHGRPQGDGSRLVLVRVTLFFSRGLLIFWCGCGSPGRLSFRRSNRRDGRRSGRAAFLSVGRALLGFALRDRLRLATGPTGARLFLPALLLMGGDHRGVATEIAPQLLGIIVVDRAGMGQGFGDAELVQFIDDLTRLYFELPRQLIDSDLTHV